MKRHLALAGAAVMVVAAMGCTAMASTSPTADSAPSSEATKRTSELRFLDQRTETEFLDLDRQGGDPSPGDAYYFGSTLRYTYDHRLVDGADAGRFLSTCVFVAGAQVKCSGALLLSRGTIEIAGTPDLSSADPITAAVVGGTGKYLDVSGEVTITPTTDENVSLLVARLR